ncbi:Kelch domain-containing protein 10 [Thelohanellus kitauei]|uniref:Kelch domain-containing protein 10 n=1 Tax=Thelohanellus kitauei TaxID=669202 RepID=A0A0C2IJC6_THEKT|nr:Kelch domain-containing protein 10 [Thelohanellus kitauei]
MTPTDFSRYCVTSVGEFIIIYYCYEGCCLETDGDLWSYNTLSRIWRRYQLPIEIAKPCYGSSICTDGNLVYIFGGSHSPYTVRSTNSLVSFDIRDATWQILSPHIEDYDHNTPPPMYGSFIFCHQGSLYVLGGFNIYDHCCSMYKFCLERSTWFLVSQNGQKPNLESRIFGTAFKNKYNSLNHRLYIFEGTRTETNRFKDVKIFYFSTNTWTTKETSSITQEYPEDDLKNDSFAFSSKFGYLSGGMSSTTHNSDIWKINIETLEWFKLENPYKRGLVYHTMSVINDSYLFTFGGWRDHNDHLRYMQKFPIRPPTLYRLCLESISRSPNLISYTKSLPAAILDELNLDNNSGFYF